MKHKILWIEDDYHDIQGLVRPLEKAGFKITNAPTAVDGYELALKWNLYDMILADLIIPIRRGIEEPPALVQAWDEDSHSGIAMVKWLLLDLKVEIPVVMLSIVNDPLAAYNLGNLPGLYYLPKRGIKPSEVKDFVFKILEIPETKP